MSVELGPTGLPEPIWVRTLGAPTPGDRRDGELHQHFAEVPEERLTLEPWDGDPDGEDAVYDLASPDPMTDEEGRSVWIYNYAGLAYDIYGPYPDDADGFPG